MEYEISKNIKIIYNDCDREYINEIIDYFNENYKKVLDFFGMEDLDKLCQIKIWEDKEKFVRELSDITGYEYPFWTTGSSKNDNDDKYSRVDYLSLKEINKIDYHKNSTVNDLKKGILHEFVHVCHSQFCDYNYPDETYLTEGVATYLAGQYENSEMTEPISKIMSDGYVEYSNYRCLFNTLVDKYSHEELLNILKNPRSVL